jgi:thiamine monophosphate kinase
VAAAWEGGEDYELLFTLTPRNAARVGPAGRVDGVALTRIGHVEKGGGDVHLRPGPRRRATGFEHFGRGSTR